VEDIIVDATFIRLTPQDIDNRSPFIHRVCEYYPDSEGCKMIEDDMPDESLATDKGGEWY